MGTYSWSRPLPGSTESSSLCAITRACKKIKAHPPGEDLEDRSGVGEVDTAVRGRRVWYSSP